MQETHHVVKIIAIFGVLVVQVGFIQCESVLVGLLLLAAVVELVNLECDLFS